MFPLNAKGSVEKEADTVWNLRRPTMKRAKKTGVNVVIVTERTEGNERKLKSFNANL